jgi:hypothetical protein
MTLSVPLTLNLTQTKVFTGYAPRTARFAVQNVITANPLALDGTSNPQGEFAATAFILAPTAGVDMERLVTMVDLTNTAHLAIPVNPLNHFKDLSVDLSAYPSGGILRIYGQTTSPPGVIPAVYTIPGEWTDLALLIDAPRDFVVGSVDTVNARVGITSRFLWATQGLRWELLAPSTLAVLAQGTQGVVQRETLGLLEWRDRMFTAAFYEMTEALNHTTYVQAHVKSITKQANSDPDTYLSWPPMNPVTFTY